MPWRKTYKRQGTKKSKPSSARSEDSQFILLQAKEREREQPRYINRNPINIIQWKYNGNKKWSWRRKLYTFHTQQQQRLQQYSAILLQLQLFLPLPKKPPKHQQPPVNKSRWNLRISLETCEVSTLLCYLSYEAIKQSCERLLAFFSLLAKKLRRRVNFSVLWRWCHVGIRTYIYEVVVGTNLSLFSQL